MFEGLLFPWQQIYHFAFYSIFRTTPEVSSKLYFVKLCQGVEKLWPFLITKELIFGFQILDLKDHSLDSLTSEPLSTDWLPWQQRKIYH